ncbi:PP2C family protein-serine/threonine phosphatase [Polymorphospora rubra]|uniref:PP2C family protein-serine/threonine phosphatase n=1 Tax=Polymorphospora rubra TaxID=338584 RepID=UPI0033D4B47C
MTRSTAIAERECPVDDLAGLRAIAALVADEVDPRPVADRRGSERQRLTRLGETLQDRLAPPPVPEVPGMQAAAYYRPAHGEPVGGDFYDVFPLDDGSWGMFLGDVVGKGSGAAALTALTRYTLRTASTLDRGPAHALARLNTILTDGLRDDVLLCTATVARLRPPTSPGGPASVVVASAGHPAPIVTRRGHARPVDCTGLIAGCLPGADYRVVEIRLEPGDALVFYSDGVTDAKLGGDRLEVEGLCRVLRGATGSTAPAVVHGLERLLTGAAADVPDDAAALVVSVPA